MADALLSHRPGDRETMIGSLIGTRKNSDQAQPDHAHAAQARTNHPRVAPSAAGNMSRKRVLIVEDNDRVRDVLEEFLGFGYTVDAAANASVALQRIGTHPPDVILLDVNMPGTDGLTLMDTIRGLGVTAPIFVMTGYDSADIARRASESGVTAYLVKPVELRKLDVMVAQAVGGRPLLG